MQFQCDFLIESEILKPKNFNSSCKDFVDINKYANLEILKR